MSISEEERLGQQRMMEAIAIYVAENPDQRGIDWLCTLRERNVDETVFFGPREGGKYRDLRIRRAIQLMIDEDDKRDADMPLLVDSDQWNRPPPKVYRKYNAQQLTRLV